MMCRPSHWDRSKGDGNNKSPVIRSKTSEGLSETPAQESEQEQDTENGKEVKQEDGEQPEDETLGEDGGLATATAPGRTSISSTSSAKSLSFLSLLRGGRRGVGDRRVQTVCQPVARQRRGLKGLFSNIKLRSKDKEDKEEAPPSPLLQSSRTNSVEIIKEDLTLTPKCQPRTLDSPETERSEPLQSSTTQKSSATTPSKTPAPQVTSFKNVSITNEHVSPLLTPEPPLVPGDKSLSSLLADISSLLTFDSISGGGDIMADVEAEWGKVSSALSADIPLPSPPPLSKSTLSSSPVSAAATVKSPSVAVSSSSSTTPASTQGKQTPAPTSTKPSTVSSPSATSSTSKTIQSTLSSITTTTTPPAYASATVGKASSFSPSLTSTAKKLATEIMLAPQNTAPESSSNVPTFPAEIQSVVSKTSPTPAQTKYSGSKTPVTSSVDAHRPESFPVSPPKATPIPISQPKTPEPQIASCPLPPVSWQIDTSSSAKNRGSVQASTDSLDGAGGQGSQGVSSKAKEQHHELHPKEKRTPPSKTMGLSKIPVVGGGRVGRLPVRESQHDDLSKDPTSPVLEEKPHFNSHNAGGKDKIISPEANTPTAKHVQEEHQQPQQAKVLTSSVRDSKIPFKHGTQSHAASQVSQTKEPPRTKIPVSKVPVRRAGNKPAATGSSTQIRK
ncbi:hypothetical protein GOODEAATRI_007249 [Goodea atripinnis]|uniref:APC membrane recruitment protein 2 n=1 Tax=Goodea atripinnis TaxID=208336 RepID=A0ABV0NI62_9TELE